MSKIERGLAEQLKGNFEAKDLEGQMALLEENIELDIEMIKTMLEEMANENEEEIKPYLESYFEELKEQIKKTDNILNVLEKDGGDKDKIERLQREAISFYFQNIFDFLGDKNEKTKEVFEEMERKIEQLNRRAKEIEEEKTEKMGTRDRARKASRKRELLKEVKSLEEKQTKFLNTIKKMEEIKRQVNNSFESDKQIGDEREEFINKVPEAVFKLGNAIATLISLRGQNEIIGGEMIENQMKEQLRGILSDPKFEGITNEELKKEVFNYLKEGGTALRGDITEEQIEEILNDCREK